MKNSSIIISVIAAILLGIIGFFVGMKYQQKRTAVLLRNSIGNARQNPNFFRNGSGMRNGTGGQFRPVVGKILSIDNNSITVQSQDGSSRIILFSSNTPIEKSTQGTASDLQVNNTVRVFGTFNSDGSVSAQDIQINPPAINNPALQQ